MRDIEIVLLGTNILILILIIYQIFFKKEGYIDMAAFDALEKQVLGPNIVKRKPYIHTTMGEHGSYTPMTPAQIAEENAQIAEEEKSMQSYYN